MAELRWNGKDLCETDAEPDLIDVEYVYCQRHDMDNRVPVNRLIQGDNYSVAKALLKDYKEKINLVYIDPPYLSERDYYSKITAEWGNKKIQIIREVYPDIWNKNVDSYLNSIFPLFKLMKELLSANGNLFVHLDWHASHYIKILLDEIFLPDNFINEIVWCYGGGGNSRRHFHRKHDVILWYAKGSDYVFNPQYRPYTEGTLQRGLTRVKGGKYHLNQEGALLNDWWTDINKILSPTAHENLKYPTQKPLALLERIIKTASNPGDMVADFFCGSGTTAAACQKLGRYWIACDKSNIAIQTTMSRMIAEGCSSFRVQKICVSGQTGPADNRLIIGWNWCEDDDTSLWVKILDYRPASANIPKTGGCPFAILIDFWEVDYDYNGEVFRSLHQEFRRKNRIDMDIQTEFMIDISLASEALIAVQVHDIFGDSAVEVIKVKK